MFFLANLLTIYGYIIIARALISWINPNPYNPLIRIIYAITDPVLVPLRRLLPDLGGLDISPFVALVIIWFIISLI